jgi:hypothetical protein
MLAVAVLWPRRFPVLEPPAVGRSLWHGAWCVPRRIACAACAIVQLWPGNFQCCDLRTDTRPPVQPKGAPDLSSDGSSSPDDRGSSDLALDEPRDLTFASYCYDPESVYEFGRPRAALVRPDVRRKAVTVRVPALQASGGRRLRRAAVRGGGLRRRAARRNPWTTAAGPF